MSVFLTDQQVALIRSALVAALRNLGVLPDDPWPAGLDEDTVALREALALLDRAMERET